MPKVCKTCKHPEKEIIDKLLLNQVALRDVAECYSLPTMSVQRHKEKHLPEALLKAQESKDALHSIELTGELKRLFERVNLLFDATDSWLRDPEDPTRYTIEPRAENVMVIYQEINDNGKQVRKRERLSVLLKRIATKSLQVDGWETKYADPRELLIKTASQLQGQLELLGKLVGKLNDGPSVEVNIDNNSLSPEQKADFRAYLLHRNGR